MCSNKLVLTCTCVLMQCHPPAVISDQQAFSAAISSLSEKEHTDAIAKEQQRRARQQQTEADAAAASGTAEEQAEQLQAQLAELQRQQAELLEWDDLPAEGPQPPAKAVKVLPGVVAGLALCQGSA